MYHIIDAARLALHALAPELRQNFSVDGKLIPGIDLAGEASMRIKPIEILAAWQDFRSSAAAREFSRRMRAN